MLWRYINYTYKTMKIDCNDSTIQLIANDAACPTALFSSSLPLLPFLLPHSSALVS